MNQSEARAEVVWGVEEQEERLVPRRLQVAPELPAAAGGSRTVRQWWAAVKASIAGAFSAERGWVYGDLEVDQAKVAAKSAEQVALARTMGPPFGSTTGRRTP